MAVLVKKVDIQLQKDAFLERLVKEGAPYAASRACGVSLNQIYKWRAEDSTFAESFRTILTACVDEVAHTLYQMIIDKSNPAFTPANKIAAAKVYMHHRGALIDTSNVTVSADSNLASISKAIADYEKGIDKSNTSQSLSQEMATQPNL